MMFVFFNPSPISRGQHDTFVFFSFN